MHATHLGVGGNMVVVAREARGLLAAFSLAHLRVVNPPLVADEEPHTTLLVVTSLVSGAGRRGADDGAAAAGAALASASVLAAAALATASAP